METLRLLRQAIDYLEENLQSDIEMEDLAGTDCKVIDIVLKYGCESPEAFSKAFQRLHDVTPLAAKKQNVRLKSFPRLSFQIQIKGGTVLPDGNAVPTEFTMLAIPVQTYAVFDSREKVPESGRTGLGSSKRLETYLLGVVSGGKLRAD